jgi:hypothetical protein
MDEQTPPTRGKGNFTVGRPDSFGNAGNEAPLGLRNVSRKRGIEKIIPQYNAEASYNDTSNQKAAGHLNELHQTLGMLHYASESRTSRVLQSRVAALGDAATTHGFTIHPDIVQGVKDIGQSLSAMDPSELPEHARAHHAAALEAASNFVRTAEPAYEPSSTGYAGTTGKLGADRMSVKIEPEYRANMFDYAGSKESDLGPKQYKKEMEATADGRYTLYAKGVKKRPEASRSAASVEQKKKRRQEREAERKAARKAE